MSDSGRGPLWLLLGLYATLGLGYSLLMPMWEAPDERAHYRLVLHLVREGGFWPRHYNQEAHQPRLYYWLASGPLRLVDRIDASSADAYAPPRAPGRGLWPTFQWSAANHRFLFGAQLLRWLNLLVGGLTLWTIHAGVRRLVPASPALALAVTALAGLAPQFLHISASVGNSALANLTGALLFRLMVELVVRRARPAELAAVTAAALMAPPLVKLTLLPMSAAVLIAVAAHVETHWRGRRLRLAALGLLLAAGLAAAFLALAPDAASDLGWMLRRRATGLRPGALEILPLAAWEFVWGYWGVVGMFTLALPEPVVVAASAVAGVGALASLRLLGPGVRPGVRARLGPRAGWLLVWAAVLLALLAIARSYLSAPATQGRHLFPCLGPLSLVMVGGWLSLLPTRTWRFAPGALAAAWTAVNLHFWIADVIPFYHQPFLD